MRAPLCPYCYNGEIVRQRISEVLYCNICKRQVEIKDTGYPLASHGKRPKTSVKVVDYLKPI